jgi:hypothetical protein
MVNGGGVCFANSTVVLTGSVFRDNMGYYGGAIHVHECSAFAIAGCTFQSNQVCPSTAADVWIVRDPGGPA